MNAWAFLFFGLYLNNGIRLLYLLIETEAIDGWDLGDGFRLWECQSMLASSAEDGIDMVLDVYMTFENRAWVVDAQSG